MNDNCVSGECMSSEGANDLKLKSKPLFSECQGVSSRPTLDLNIDKSNGLNVIYTNSDVLHNKLKELEVIALNEKADIIAITETLLKNMPPHAQPEDFVFKISG